MNKWAPKQLTYIGTFDEQVRWGSNDDPRGLLKEGKSYAVKSVDVRSSHTKVELVDFPGKRFNSCSFSEDKAEGATP
jgi:hypothetical protein